MATEVWLTMLWDQWHNDTPGGEGEYFIETERERDVVTRQRKRERRGKETASEWEDKIRTGVYWNRNVNQSLSNPHFL